MNLTKLMIRKENEFHRLNQLKKEFTTTKPKIMKKSTLVLMVSSILILPLLLLIIGAISIPDRKYSVLYYLIESDK